MIVLKFSATAQQKGICRGSKEINKTKLSLSRLGKRRGKMNEEVFWSLIGILVVIILVVSFGVGYVAVSTFAIDEKAANLAVEVREKVLPMATLVPTLAPTRTLVPTFTPTATPTLVPATATSTPLPPPDKSGTVSGNVAWVRDGPGPNFKAVAKLEDEDKVDILGRNEDGSWLHVELVYGTSGWAETKYIGSDLDIDTLDQIESPSVPPATATPIPPSGDGGGFFVE